MNRYTCISTPSFGEQSGFDSRHSADSCGPFCNITCYPRVKCRLDLEHVAFNLRLLKFSAHTLETVWAAGAGAMTSVVLPLLLHANKGPR